MSIGMKISLEELMINSKLRDEKRSEGHEELVRLGEAKIIAMFESLAQEASVDSITKLIGLADLVQSGLRNKLLAQSENSKLTFAPWVDFIFCPITKFEIPISEWHDVAQEACKLILLFLKSKGPKINEMKAFKEYYKLRQSTEEKFSKDPKYKKRFQGDPYEMGSN